MNDLEDFKKFIDKKVRIKLKSASVKERKKARDKIHFCKNEGDLFIALKHLGLDYNKLEGEYNKEKKGILINPKLFDVIIQELDKKIEGELKSKKAIFLSLCSVWVEGVEVPLNTFVSSESSAGKSYVCKRIVELFPKEIVEYRTKISPEAFTYWKSNDPNHDWTGKICYLEDISQALLDSPTFRVMCSEGSKATIVRNQMAIELDIKGKPVVLVTTARTNPSTEILNRFNIIQLDETSKQTRNITKRQALQKRNEDYNPEITISLRKLIRKKVYIPYGIDIHSYLSENYTFDDIRMRRDFSKLLDLIRCSAVLHQFQREINENGELIAIERDYNIAREVINYITKTTLKGLTHKLKRAFGCCIELGEFTANEIHSKFPFVSEKMWRIYLDMLCERDLLTTELRNVEGVKQRVTFYCVKESISIDLPSYNVLRNPSVVTDVSKVSKVSKVSDDSEQMKQKKQLKGKFAPEKSFLCEKCGFIHLPNVDCDKIIAREGYKASV